MYRNISKLLFGVRYNHSYTFGASNETLVSNLMPQILETNNNECPDSIACISQHQNIIKSYRDLYQDVNKLVNVLLELGCKRGTRVGIWAPNCYEWIVTQFSTAKIGSILVNINPGYKLKELTHCLNLVGCHTLISSQRVKTSNYYDLLQTLIPSLSALKSTKDIEFEGLQTLKNIVMLSHAEEPAPHYFTRYNDLMASANSDVKHIQGIQFDDAINIQFTSGTTGNPKGATLSQFNLINNVRLFHKRLTEGMADENNIICCPVPFYHTFGCVVGSLMNAYSKSTIVLPSDTFSPDKSLKSIQEYKCNYIYGTPTMFIDITNSDSLSKFNTSSLKRGLMGGTTCPPEVIKSFHKAFPSVEHTTVAYGSTELSPVCSSTSIKDSYVNLHETVGRALDHTEFKVIDPKSGEVKPIGEPGELLVRGYCTFIGYWNQLDKTREAIVENRWYHTGDVGTIDKEGYIRVLSRVKDMIIRGGENLYPREIEEFLLTNPIVSDVYVVGVPDKRMGEEICAFVKLKSNVLEISSNDIKSFCKDKISHFKIPRYIEFVDDFPRTVTGKVQKFILKDIATKKYSVVTNSKSK